MLLDANLSLSNNYLEYPIFGKIGCDYFVHIPMFDSLTHDQKLGIPVEIAQHRPSHHILKTGEKWFHKICSYNILEEKLESFLFLEIL